MYRHQLIAELQERFKGCSPLEIDCVFAELLLNKEGADRTPWFEKLFAVQMNVLRDLGYSAILSELERKREAVFAYAREHVRPKSFRSPEAYRLAFCPVIPYARVDYREQMRLLEVDGKPGFFGAGDPWTCLEPDHPWVDVKPGDPPMDAYFIFDVAMVVSAENDLHARLAKFEHVPTTAAETIAVLRHMVVGPRDYGGSIKLACYATTFRRDDGEEAPAEIVTIDGHYEFYPHAPHPGETVCALGRLPDRL